MFFYYATELRINNKNIDENYIMQDSDFDLFKNYISNKEYTYKTKTETTLDNLKIKAEKEDYFEAINQEYNQLLKKLELNKKDDLVKNKEKIKAILTGEIISRYYYQKGRIKAGLNFDTEFKRAVEVLQNTKEYETILEGNI